MLSFSFSFQKNGGLNNIYVIKIWEKINKGKSAEEGKMNGGGKK